MGYVHIYYGDGPGKTTAAMGLAVRAAGQNMRVAVAQFLKDAYSGERASLARLPGIILLPAPEQIPFTFAMTEKERQKYQMFLHDLWRQILVLLTENQVDLLVLDEWGDALEQGWFSAEERDALWQAAGDTELVITTHALPDFLRERADYLTEMRAKRHPFNQGRPARRGIEY